MNEHHIINDRLLIDLGNTNTVWARVVNNEISQKLSLPTAQLQSAKIADFVHSFIIGKDADNADVAEITETVTDEKKITPPTFISSVVPTANATVLEILRTAEITNITLINPAEHFIMENRLTAPQTTGTDRLLAALAAYSLITINKRREAVLVIQAGTALTVDIVDKNGIFGGGVIMPGVQMWLKMLSAAAQLPEFSAQNVNWQSREAGGDTASAILNGAAYGLVGATKEAVRKLLMVLSSAGGQVPIIVITGGWGEALLEFFPAQYCPDLVLQGINYFAIREAEK